VWSLVQAHLPRGDYDFLIGMVTKSVFMLGDESRLRRVHVGNGGFGDCLSVRGGFSFNHANGEAVFK
jgi:hypothetical protein